MTVLIAMTINTVFAYIPNADGGGNTTATKGTWSSSNQGYRITVTNKDGRTQAGPYDFTNAIPSGVTHTQLKNKLGSSSKGPKDFPTGMPLPIKMSGDSMQGQGKALKTWMMSKHSSGNLNLEELLFY